jgi:hypothetical protein
VRVHSRFERGEVLLLTSLGVPERERASVAPIQDNHTVGAVKEMLPLNNRQVRLPIISLVFAKIS